MKHVLLTVTSLAAVVLGAIALALPAPASRARAEAELVNAIQLNVVSKQQAEGGGVYYALGQQVDLKQIGTSSAYYALVWVNPAGDEGELRVSFQLGGQSYALGNMVFRKPGGTSSAPFPLIVSLYPSSVAQESRGAVGKLYVELFESGRCSARFARDARVH